MPKPPFLKLAIGGVVVLTVAGVGYAGLTIWRDRMIEEIPGQEAIREESSTQDLTAIIEDGFIVVRDGSTSKEISRIPQKTYTDRYGKDRQVIYVIVNENYGKLYVFVSDPELSGVTGNIVGSIVESDFNGANMRGLSRWEGSELDKFQFSPDGRFLSYRTLWGVGAGSYSISIVVENVVAEKGESYDIGPPKSKDECIDLVHRQYTESLETEVGKVNDHEINAAIGSYEWLDETTIEFTFSCEAGVGQLSPIETWRYTLNTKEYQLINTEQE